jgi:hypothetical protein
MKLKYQTNGFWPIETVEVEKETENSVWINGQQNRKLTEYHCYFDNFEDAKNHVIGEAQAGIEKAKRQMEYAEKNMATARSLESPNVES